MEVFPDKFPICLGQCHPLPPRFSLPTLPPHLSRSLPGEPYHGVQEERDWGVGVGGTRRRNHQNEPNVWGQKEVTTCEQHSRSSWCEEGINRWVTSSCHSHHPSPAAAGSFWGPPWGGGGSAALMAGKAEGAGKTIACTSLIGHAGSALRLLLEIQPLPGKLKSQEARPS